jgi:hypothetical protein
MKCKICLLFCFICSGALLFAQDVQSRPGFIQKEAEGGFILKFGSASFGPYEEMTNSPFVSLDGKNYIFTLRKNKIENWIVANGKEYGPFKGDWMGDLRVSDDGSSWVVNVFAKTDKGEESSVIANGKEYTGIGKTDRADFFPGGFFYFISSTDKDNRRESWIVTPSAKYGPYEEVRDVIPSEDNKSILFSYRNKGAEYLRVKDKEIGPNDRVDTVFAEGKKGRAIGFILNGKSGSMLYMGSVQLSYERIEGWYFNPVGPVWAVKAFKGDKTILNINGKETVYDWVNWMNYENGYFYVAQKTGGGTVTIVQNGKEIGVYAEARETYLTPGGSWGAAVAKKKGSNMYRLVVINGKEYEGESLRLAEQTDGFQFIWLKYADNDQVMLQSLKVAP